MSAEQTMTTNNVLTADARATIMDACQSISRSADELKAGCAIGDEWPDAGDKAFYDAELRLLERLTALLAHPQPYQPAASEAARDAKDAARYRWMRSRGGFLSMAHNQSPEDFDAAIDSMIERLDRAKGE